MSRPRKHPRNHSRPNPARPKQAGRRIERREGDFLHVPFPDGGQKSFKVHLRKYQHRPPDSHGSHLNGKHKLG